jgi:hypothetical protein
MSSDRKDAPVGGNQGQGDNPSKPFVTQEKTSLGGDFNSGVTSQDDTERQEIERKGGMANIDQSGVRVEESGRRSEEERVSQGGGD